MNNVIHRSYFTIGRLTIMSGPNRFYLLKEPILFSQQSNSLITKPIEENVPN